MGTVTFRRLADLDARTLYSLLQLRVDMFVVEQHCPYPELDGRDTEPATEHSWLEDPAGPTAYLRILHEPDGIRIGRLWTRADARGAGAAARLPRARSRRTQQGPPAARCCGRPRQSCAVRPAASR